MFQKKNTKYAMIPPFPLLKPAPTDLYTEIRGEEDTRKLQIIRISWISQYTEVKSKKILEEIQRFTRISLIYIRIFRNHEII